jgi:hypothetical protein
MSCLVKLLTIVGLLEVILRKGLQYGYCLLELLAFLRPQGTILGNSHTSIHFSKNHLDKPDLDFLPLDLDLDILYVPPLFLDLAFPNLNLDLDILYVPPLFLYSLTSQADAYADGHTLNLRFACDLTRSYKVLFITMFGIYYNYYKLNEFSFNYKENKI